jgi:hypothetical protein
LRKGIGKGGLTPGLSPKAERGAVALGICGCFKEISFAHTIAQNTNIK